MTESGQRLRYASTWYTAVLLALWVLLHGAGPGEAEAPRYRVAVMTPGGGYAPALDGFREGLAQLGYYEGHNIAFLVEDVQGDVASFAGRAAKLVEAQPDVIFTIGTASTAAAKQVTATIPIIFTFVADPLRSGLIASYASSQNNVTGISNYAGPLPGKRLEVLQEIAPGIKRVLVLVNPQESVAQMSFQALAEVAPKLNIELVRHNVTSKEEIEQTLRAVPQGAVDAIYHVPSNLVGTNIALLVHKAREDRIPLSVHEHSMAEQGALVSYGAEFRLLGAQAARLVAKILKGAAPSELPIQTPEKLLLAVNLTTARAIGLDIPSEMLERIERLVE